MLRRVRQALETKGGKRILFVLAFVGALAFSMGYNPPVGRVHHFSKASDYRPEKEAGCTNSGDGCHGAETEYRDFNDYHPDAECTTCHDYQGIGCIPCHSPNKNHECATCHDGSMEGAPDVVRLVDPYPRGHYRETSHTALGTDMKRVVRAADGGKAGATCGDCHSRDLRESHTGVPVVPGSPYGTDIGCGECHNDLRSYGLGEVLEDWEGRACEDCHKAGGSSPMHGAAVADAVEGTGELGCGTSGPGCHEVNDLHALHPDEPATCSGSIAGEPGCHDLEVEAHKPVATSCGGAGDQTCHLGYVNDDYSHEADREVHSPKTKGPADDTSHHGVPCGGCHRMDPDGVSLVEEHAAPHSEMSEIPGDRCRNCHTHPASIDAVADDWSARDTRGSCSACHGREGLDGAHGPDPSGHDAMPGSEGCAGTGIGCHPSGDLLGVGEPTIAGGLHSTCLRCHDWRAADGNMAYDPDLRTCGPGRDCHAAAGEYDPVSGVHDGAGGRADGLDRAHHEAGGRQARAVNVDPSSGISTWCESCHDMTLGAEHARPNSSLAYGEGTLCVRCHNRDTVTGSVVKAGWRRKDSVTGCLSCHVAGGPRSIHGGVATAHAGVELSPVGTPAPGTCVSRGCHGSADLRNLHRRSGCTVAGCHSPAGDINGSGKKSCGGFDPLASCHTGFSAAQHFVEHRAELTGTVAGVPYQAGANIGCFGCHPDDLVSIHSTSLIEGSMEGGGTTPCSVCHADPDDPDRNRFAALPAVRDAVASRDRRCIACHASGDADDGPRAVASAHRDVTTSTPRPSGKVWADPFEGWRVALDSPWGGGHNVLSSGVAGAASDRRFPGEVFEVGGRTYVWPLPPNSGSTAWLRASVFGAAAVATTESISHIQIKCQDCHSIPASMTGPHGASAEVRIDPAYSQTKYANPPWNEFQFEATGTDRVICFKCHPMQASRSPLVRPGGNAVHGRHVQHTARYPASMREHYGEKCVDCHVRIPHAWRRPRMLVRTVETTGGIAPDRFPYVRNGHDGLVGMRLKSYTAPADPRADSCATGGCYDGNTSGWHPWPSDIPTATYWP